MLVVHVHARVRPGRVADFLAATLVNARESLAGPGVLRSGVIPGQDAACQFSHAVLQYAPPGRISGARPGRNRRGLPIIPDMSAVHWERADLIICGTPPIPFDPATELVIAPPIARSG